MKSLIISFKLCLTLLISILTSSLSAQDSGIEASEQTETNFAAQCNHIYMMRPSFGLASDDPVHIYIDDDHVCTINRGDRVDLEVCGFESIKAKASLSQEELSVFNIKDLKFSSSEVFYLKIGAVPGFDEPTLTIMDERRGRSQYENDKKFKGKVSAVSIGDLHTVTTENAKAVPDGQRTGEHDEYSDSVNSHEELDLSNKNAIDVDSVMINQILSESIVDYKDEVDQKGFERFYILNGRLYNSSNDKLTAESVKQGRAFVVSAERLAIITDFEGYRHRVQLFNSEGAKVNSYDLEGFVSPDCSYILTLDDGDIWRSELNILSGQKTQLRRLTELGLFETRLDHDHWYKDILVFYPGTEYQYSINTSTGQITNLHEKLGVSDEVRPISGNQGRMGQDWCLKSPGLRYSPIYDRQGMIGGSFNTSLVDVGLYDFKTEKYLLDLKSSFYWISRKHTIEYDRSKTHDLILRNIERGTSLKVETATEASIGPSELGAFPWPNNFNTASSRNQISPAGEYILYMDGLSDRGFGFKRLLLYDLKSRSKKVIEEDVRVVLSLNRSYRPCAWLSNNEWIYVRAGDLMAQGTWYLKANTMEKKRLSSFLADHITPLEGTSICYFVANNKLYKFDADTLETDEIMLGDDVFSINISSLDFNIPLYQP